MIFCGFPHTQATNKTTRGAFYTFSLRKKATNSYGTPPSFEPLRTLETCQTLPLDPPLLPPYHGKPSRSVSAYVVKRAKRTQDLKDLLIICTCYNHYSNEYIYNEYTDGQPDGNKTLLQPTVTKRRKRGLFSLFISSIPIQDNFPCRLFHSDDCRGRRRSWSDHSRHP